MLSEDPGPAETAITFADQFLDAGVAKLDSVFGADYARQNPLALAAYVAACASNLNAFMTAATAMADVPFEDDMGDALAQIMARMPAEPAPQPKGRRR